MCEADIKKLQEENKELKRLLAFEKSQSNLNDITTIIDIESLESIFEKFSKLTGYPSGLVKQDTREILISTGWTDICKTYHRGSSSSEYICKESNKELTKDLENLHEISLRECQHGMVDGATPIIIDGEHLADLFSGQVLFDKPDIEKFKRGANEFGYDVEAYLKALDKVKITSKKELKEVLEFLSDIAKLIAQLGKEKKEVEYKTIQNAKHIQLLQQQSKMAAMGEMMGAIAHQWRQPLNELGIRIQNIKYKYKSGDLDENYINDFVDKNKKTIMFMSNTIDDFRSFFRVDKEKKDFKVKEATLSVIDMQLAQLKNYDIKINVTGDEFLYNGFQTEYQQVVLNLINNAKDAIIENKIDSPKINIVIRDNKITLEDNAGGIDKCILDRIFEPYFTTKEQGKGTGIGLYMSKMIIEKNMGAKIDVKNTKHGAMFTIEFV